MGINKITGAAGFEHLGGTSAHTGKKFYALIVQEDTVITALTYTKMSDSSSTVNGLTTDGLSGKTLKAGAYLPCPDDYYISAVTMSSGSVIGYKLT